jgi:hypothetical protein
VSDELAHLDEDGQPCKRHPPADLSALLQLAALGSRVAGYNHDVASKIQGVMMAVDEIGELARTSELQRAAETARVALGELSGLLKQNRALAKPPSPILIELRELLARSAQRVGVRLEGSLPEGAVEVAVPLMTQGLALAIDAVAGTERRRSLALGARLEGGSHVLVLPIAPQVVPNIGDSLAIAAWIVRQDRGELRCSDAAVVVRLPAV